MAAGKFDRPKDEKVTVTGKDLQASVVEDGNDKSESAESYKEEKPLLGSDEDSHPKADKADDKTDTQPSAAQASASPRAEGNVDDQYKGVGADIPDKAWVKEADLHAGSESGAPEHVKEVQEKVQEAQPKEGMGPDQVAALEAVEEQKRAVSQKAIEDIQSKDFEVGGTEENYLQGGVPVAHLEHIKKGRAEKEKRAAAKALRKLQGKK